MNTISKYHIERVRETKIDTHIHYNPRWGVVVYLER